MTIGLIKRISIFSQKNLELSRSTAAGLPIDYYIGTMVALRYYATAALSTR